MSRRFAFGCSFAAALWVLCSASTEAQFFFEADAVFMDRSGGIGGGALINGTNPVSTSRVSSGVEPGYRLTFGSQLLDYQIDTSFTQVSPWQGSAAGTLTNLVILDETAGNPIVNPGGLANTIAFPNGLFDAATQAAELTESERLRPGSTWSYRDRANYRDFELNFGSARDLRPWRMGVGYRHIRYDGNSQFVLSGTFDAIDTTAVVDAQNALVGGSMTAAGFTGAGGFDALGTAGAIDTLTYSSTGRAENELHGAQATFGMRMLDGNWVTLEGVAKAGIYQNNVHGRLTEAVLGTGNGSSAFQRSFTDRSVSAAFAGNLGLKAIVSLTDYINIVGGYDVTFLAGLALAGDQANGLATNPTTGARVYRVNNTGDILLHGANLGLELNW